MLHPDRYSTTGVLLRKLFVVVHDAESGDGAADALVRLLQAPGDRPLADGRKYGSGYHAITDGNGGYTEVATANMGPYAAPPANKVAWHVCMPGRANQTREQWLDPTSRAHIRGVARFILDKAVVDGFPFYRLNPNELLAGDRGYCGHVDVSKAWGESDHTDPGPSFPWDVLAEDIDELSAPPSLPPTTPTPQEAQPMIVIVGDKDNKADPKRYAWVGAGVTWIENEEAFNELVMVFGLNPRIHPDPAKALAEPFWKPAAWIAANLVK